MNGDDVYMSIQSELFGSLLIDNAQPIYENENMRFENATNILEIVIIRDNLDELLGSNVLKFILEDNSDQRLTNSIEMTINIHEAGSDLDFL